MGDKLNNSGKKCLKTQRRKEILSANRIAKFGLVAVLHCLNDFFFFFCCCFADSNDKVIGTQEGCLANQVNAWIV